MLSCHDGGELNDKPNACYDIIRPYDRLLFRCSRSPGESGLPAILGDHMVLLQGKSVPIWGWADPGEGVAVQFLDQRRSTRAGEDGSWKVTLSPIKAGGPFEMTIRGNRTLVLKEHPGW